ncbi:MAG: hypothetical protein KR126chlam1_00590 [Chlamydiae bacterium]|nr:hypothetical protein [Chlamydiota bacterium]
MIVKLGLFLMTLLAAGIPWQEEVTQIEREILVLRDLQEKYQASASRSSNNAMRWQFQRENYLDARRAWDKVAHDKQKIRELQDEIDDLEKHKAKLLQEHGKSSSP